MKSVKMWSKEVDEEEEDEERGDGEGRSNSGFRSQEDRIKKRSRALKDKRKNK